MPKKILQTGLHTTDPREVEALVERVTNFNMDHIGYAVKIDIIPHEEGDQWCPVPHYKLRFLFPSREIQERFWTTG